MSGAPAGSGIPPLPDSPPSPSIPGYWLCQFDVRVDLPSTLTVPEMERKLAHWIAHGIYYAGLRSSGCHVTLIATSTGSVANPTSP